MSIRLAPKVLATALLTGAVLFMAAPSAQAWGGGPGYGPPPHAYGHPVPPPHFRGPPPPYAHPYARPWKRWGWHRYHRAPPWAYGPPRHGPAW